MLSTSSALYIFIEELENILVTPKLTRACPIVFKKSSLLFTWGWKALFMEGVQGPQPKNDKKCKNKDKIYFFFQYEM